MPFGFHPKNKIDTSTKVRSPASRSPDQCRVHGPAMQRPAASKRTKERPKRKPGPQLSVGKDVTGVKPGERVSLCGKYIRGVDGKTRPVSSGSRAKPPTTKAPKSSQPPSRAGPPQITAPRPKLYGDALLKQKIHWEREKLFSRGKQLFEKAGMAVEAPSQAPTRQVQTLRHRRRRVLLLPRAWCPSMSTAMRPRRGATRTAPHRSRS